MNQEHLDVSNLVTYHTNGLISSKILKGTYLAHFCFQHLRHGP
jgi:hypothetical protein